jgi:hypothetical protein
MDLPFDDCDQLKRSDLAPLDLSPGEQVVWSGRPRSMNRLVWQSAPKTLLGLAIISFVVFWMVMVMRGGHNGWEKGQAVAPFAPQNVLIAAVAGLGMIPPALYILTWPIRDWQRLRKSSYFLTDRRVIIVEPGVLGCDKTRSYRPNALRLMRVEEHSDGSGDLIFESRSTWTGLAQTVGFVGIDVPRGVEVLVRKTLRNVELGRSAAQVAASSEVWKSYRLWLAIRLFQFVAFAAGALVVFCIAADIGLFVGLLVLQPVLSIQFTQRLIQEYGVSGVAVGIVAGVGTVIGGIFVSGMFFHFALRFPIEIRIHDDRVISFRSRIRTISIAVDDIVVISTGRWFDPNRFNGLVRFKGGKLTFVNRFSNFKDFLTTVKDLNPAIEVKGF